MDNPYPLIMPPSSTPIELFPPVPGDTATAAQLVIKNQNFYISIGRQVNNLFIGYDLDNQARAIHISRGDLARLYLITIFQYIEMLADFQAVEAVEKRVDWQFALHLPLNTPRLPVNDLCQFRKWLSADWTRLDVLQGILSRIGEITLVGRKPRLRRKEENVIAQVCLLNRLAILWTAMGDALQLLAAEQPAWLESIYLPQWYQRYGKSTQGLVFAPSLAEQKFFAQVIGEDGKYLLNAIATSTVEEVRLLSIYQALRLVWDDQYSLVEGKPTWKTEGCASCPLPAECRI